MQSSLDDAYAERSELSRLLDDVQRKRHRLEEERAMLQRKVEAWLHHGGPTARRRRRAGQQQMLLAPAVSAAGSSSKGGDGTGA